MSQDHVETWKHVRGCGQSQEYDCPDMGLEELKDMCLRTHHVEKPQTKFHWLYQWEKVNVQE